MRFLVFRRGVFVVSLWWNVWQRWFVNVRFLVVENYAVFWDLFFSTGLGAFEDYGVEAVAGVDAGEGSQGAVPEA